MKRFYLLDICRGIAALSVVIWHYQHFFYQPGEGLYADFSRPEQPFYNILWVFYEHGGMAVHFFFCLSGFIFFWLYLHKISDKKVGVWSFSILRFSRLYPLIFVTLIFVAIFQTIFLKINGNFIVFPFNDLKHFLLNLFVISYWGFQDGFSFNEPAWSVSGEIFAYCIFFLFATLGLRKFWHIIVVLLLTYPMAKINENLAQVVFGFFVGGGTFIIYDMLVKRSSVLLRKKYFIPISTIIICTASVFIRSTQNETLRDIALVGILFPSVILLAALFQRVNFNFGKNLSLFGDLSYSIYLTHFPVQLIAIGFSQYTGYTFHKSNLFFILYLMTVIIISLFVYKRFELPCKNYIRQKFIIAKNDQK